MKRKKKKKTKTKKNLQARLVIPIGTKRGGQGWRHVTAWCPMQSRLVLPTGTKCPHLVPGRRARTKGGTFSPDPLVLARHPGLQVVFDRDKRPVVYQWVVDKLFKYTYFVAMKHPIRCLDVAKQYMQHISKLPSSLMSNRDCIFISTVWIQIN